MNNWIVYTLVTGDFPGFNVAGIEEDNPVVIAVLALHTLLFG